MRITKCVDDFSNPRLLSLKTDELQVRVTGDEQALEINRIIFGEAQNRGLCRVGKYSRMLDVKYLDWCRRQFFTVEINENTMTEED